MKAGQRWRGKGWAGSKWPVTGCTSTGIEGGLGRRRTGNVEAAEGATAQPIPILPPPSLPDPPASPVITPSTSHPVPPIQPPDVSPDHALSDSDSDLDVADATPEVDLAPPCREKHIPGWLYSTVASSGVTELPVPPPAGLPRQGAAAQPIPILPPPSLPDPPASPVITPSTSHPVPPIQPPDVTPDHALSDSDSDLDVADATPEVDLAPPRREKRIPGWLYSTVASSEVTELPVPPPAGLPRRSARLQKRGQVATSHQRSRKPIWLSNDALGAMSKGIESKIVRNGRKDNKPLLLQLQHPKLQKPQHPRARHQWHILCLSSTTPGSEEDLLSPQLATKLMCTMQPFDLDVDAFTPGIRTRITQIATKVQFSVQQAPFERDFLVSPLTGCDMLIGNPLDDYSCPTH
ncbi:hypothetical protein L7F22_017243 [Adiantum nelumboides]|nr:hypothetical protein [Adiantum nelumboides]